MMPARRRCVPNSSSDRRGPSIITSGQFQGATLDAWFTPDETDTSTARVDHLWDVNPSVPTSTVVGSPLDPGVPGHILRGWLHVCLPATGTYVAIVRFPDTSDNPNWNDRSEVPVSALGGRTDVVTGQFFQVIPDEAADNA